MFLLPHINGTIPTTSRHHTQLHRMPHILTHTQYSVLVFLFPTEEFAIAIPRINESSIGTTGNIICISCHISSSNFFIILMDRWKCGREERVCSGINITCRYYFHVYDSKCFNEFLTWSRSSFFLSNMTKSRHTTLDFCKHAISLIAQHWQCMLSLYFRLLLFDSYSLTRSANLLLVSVNSWGVGSASSITRWRLYLHLLCDFSCMARWT